MCSLVATTLLVPAGPAQAAFSDVPGGYWAESAIAYTAQDRTWLRNYGTSTFRPEASLLRRHLARAVILAFAPNAEAGPTFSDMSSDDDHFRFASAAVDKGWMRAKDGLFRPDAPVRSRDLDRALVRALGLSSEITGLTKIQTKDGARFDHPAAFAEIVLARQLDLHRNHPSSSEKRELWPGEVVRRADAAFALHRAARTSSWQLNSLSQFRNVVLPTMSAAKRKVVTFALKQAGAPYVYAGEWHTPTPSGYCCGSQAEGGFDCSGFVWWVLRAPDGMWSNTAYRPYKGWKLPERSSRDMARQAPTRIGLSNARPGDILFFDGDDSHRGWRGVDHAGIYLGAGWMIHSASGIDGVSLDRVRDNWYRDHFKWARRVIS
jgi:cell wall-associated NlpC family hydrolase